MDRRSPDIDIDTDCIIDTLYLQPEMAVGQPWYTRWIAVAAARENSGGDATLRSGDATVGDTSPIASDASGAPLLDAFQDESQLPFFLTKLGDTAEVTPEHLRADALRWAHRQGHKGMRGTLHRLLSEGFKWPNMYKDCLEIARGCVQCQRFTAKKYGFYPYGPLMLRSQWTMWRWTYSK